MPMERKERTSKVLINNDILNAKIPMTGTASCPPATTHGVAESGCSSQVKSLYHEIFTGREWLKLTGPLSAGRSVGPIVPVAGKHSNLGEKKNTKGDQKRAGDR